MLRVVSLVVIARIVGIEWTIAWIICLDRDFLRCRRDCSRHEAPCGAAVEASGVDAG
jgi:hypothetical protein